MIVSIIGRLAENVRAGKATKGFPANLMKVASRRLQELEEAISLEDLRIPPGRRLEKLKRDRIGQHSVRINDQWRVCFVWTEHGPKDVEITDYHD